jgi:cell wall-associated NlpC family hydrolase
MRRGEAIAARARSLVGVRFRAQGREADQGLDCVGLVAAALEQADVRRDYALRGGSERVLADELARASLRRVSEAQAGDLMVMQAGPGQIHLGIWTGAGLVHADAGLRRVVERPGAVPWPVLAVWRDGATPAIGCADGPSTTRDGPPPGPGEV